MDEPLIEWTIANISIPSDNYTLNATFQSYLLWFYGSIANDFCLPGEVGESDFAGEVGESNFAGEVGESDFAGEVGESDCTTSNRTAGFAGEAKRSRIYVAVSNITLTYCLPCNFDILDQTGIYIAIVTAVSRQSIKACYIRTYITRVTRN